MQTELRRIKQHRSPEPKTCIANGDDQQAKGRQAIERQTEQRLDRGREKASDENGEQKVRANHGAAQPLGWAALQEGEQRDPQGEGDQAYYDR